MLDLKPVNQGEEKALTLGSRIRNCRLSNGMTVKSLASKAGVTSGFLSQVEHDRVAPSIDTLRRIARALEIPVFHLLIEDNIQSELVRSFERRRVSFPGRNLVYEVISAEPERHFGVMVGKLGPNETSADELMSHGDEECLVVQAGILEVEFPSKIHRLEAGDSLHFDPSVPHRLRNPGQRPCSFLMILSPPRF